MDWVSRTDPIEPRRLKAPSRRSEAKGALPLASDPGATLVTGHGLWAAWGTWWTAPFFVVHGYLLNCLFATQHECNQQTAFKSRRLNDATRAFTGVMQLYPATPPGLAGDAVPFRAPSPHGRLEQGRGLDQPRQMRARLPSLTTSRASATGWTGRASWPRCSRAEFRSMPHGSRPPNARRPHVAASARGHDARYPWRPVR